MGMFSLGDPPEHHGKGEPTSHCEPTTLGKSLLRSSADTVFGEPLDAHISAILLKLDQMDRKLDQLFHAKPERTRRPSVQSAYRQNLLRSESFGNLSLHSGLSRLSSEAEKHGTWQPHFHDVDDTPLSVVEEIQGWNSELDGDPRPDNSMLSRTSFRAYGLSASINAMSRARAFSLKIYSLLDDPSSSRCAYLIQATMMCVIMLSVLLTLLQTTEHPVFDAWLAAIIETAFDAIFILEVILRFAACPNRLRFLCSAYNVIDVFSIFTLALRTSTGFLVPRSQDDYTVANYVLVTVVPTLRLLKVLRRSTTLRLLRYAMSNALEALVVPVFVLLVIELLFSSLIYVLEPRDNIHSLPHAMWLVVVTISTVGYGATVPSTVGGFLVTAVLVACGVLYMALPMSIIGIVWDDVWSRRFEILLMDQVRERVGQQGFTCNEIHTLFESFDSSKDGSLDLDEFCMMVDKMQLGLSMKSVVHLFDNIDKNDDDLIDMGEFMKALFPGEYLKLGKKRSSLTEKPEKQRSSRSSRTSNSHKAKRDVSDISQDGEVGATRAAIASPETSCDIQHLIDAVERHKQNRKSESEQQALPLADLCVEDDPAPRRLLPSFPIPVPAPDHEAMPMPRVIAGYSLSADPVRI